MTANRRSKRAIRSRMEQTGEKYTQARRALAAPGGKRGGAGGDPPITWPQDPLGWFDDQAWNAILLADDEARMLSHPRVEPEHLLLAAARYGTVERILAGEGIGARAIHDVIAAIRGSGGKLKLRPPRSPASEEVLRRAVAVAAARGVLGPGTEHLLLALGEQELPARILAGLGVGSVQALVDAGHELPPIRPPVEHARLAERAAVLAARGAEPPSPGPMPPLFERFTARARDAINAGVRYARRANDRWVEPSHLLFGVLNAETGVAAAVRARYGWDRPLAPPADPRYPDDTGMMYRRDPGNGNVLTYAKSPYSRATGIFTPEARRIVAEDVLIVAERLDHKALTTGHVLLGILERYAYLTIDFISALPPIREVTAAVTAALPGQEDT
ncbi:MAG: Clp protease N-terminal domain-containing protein [Gemmatimonadota bacterium]